MIRNLSWSDKLLSLSLMIGVAALLSQASMGAEVELPAPPRTSVSEAQKRDELLRMNDLQFRDAIVRMNLDYRQHPKNREACDRIALEAAKSCTSGECRMRFHELRHSLRDTKLGLFRDHGAALAAMQTDLQTMLTLSGEELASNDTRVRADFKKIEQSYGKIVDETRQLWESAPDLRPETAAVSESLIQTRIMIAQMRNQLT